MQVAVIELIEHGLNGFVITRQRLTYAFRKTRVADEISQALARETQVPGTIVGNVVSGFFRPARF